MESFRYCELGLKWVLTDFIGNVVPGCYCVRILGDKGEMEELEDDY